MRYLEEGSYSFFTDQGSKPRSNGLGLLPWPAWGVEIHLHTSHSILLPFWNLRRRTERPLQSMTGRGIRILNSKVTLRLSATLIPKSVIVVLEIFFAGNTKENSKSLKPVSVHYRNKAWINKYRDSFLLKLLWTILILLVYIFINLLKTENEENHSDFHHKISEIF